VVEIGSGTGLNFAYYPAGIVEVLATEPDPHMVKRLRKAAERAPVPIYIAEASADRLPIEGASVDVLVSTLVLCSVPDVPAALREARRVFKSDGRMLFYEHVRSRDPRLARKQDRWRRPWGFFAAGCHPNRDTVGAIEAAGFLVERLDRFDVKGNWLATPHALGSARMPVDSTT